jgi:multiple sugar transport system ATP-binding protein
MEDGRVRQIGTPREVFQRPANVFVAGFIGSTPMNLLEGECVPGVGDPTSSWTDEIDVAGVRLPVPEEATGLVGPGDKVIAGIRPEYLQEAENGIEGRVEIVENLGTTSLVTLATAGPNVQLTVPEDREPTIGSTMRVAPQPGRTLLYRTDDGDLIEES